MDKIKFYFKKIHNQLEANFNKAYKEYGLTSTQLDILLYLGQETERERTLTDIAAHFGVRHTSAIHVLKLLEKKGFICRHAAEGVRAKPIRLTDSGRQLILRITQNEPFLDQIMFAGLSPSDRQLLEKMLQQIYENLANCK